MAIAAYSEPDPVKIPGDFARHPETGAPYVASITKTRQPKGNKPALLAEAQRRGLELPAKPTVEILKALLGAEPADEMYGRPSALGKQVENLTNLQKWSERAVALGIFIAPELLIDLASTNPEQLNLDDKATRKLLDTIAVKAKNAAQAGLAAERGTHTHELAEDSDQERDWIERARSGEDLGMPLEAQRALVAAWEAMLGRLGIEILAVEARVVDDEWRQAGSLDRICRLGQSLTFAMVDGTAVVLEAGWIGILDIKTGRLRIGPDGHPDHWLGYAVQIACYAKSRPYDPDARTRGDWPWPLDQRYGIIAHLDVLSALAGNAACRLVLVDLEAGRHAGNLCVAGREWEKRRDVFSRITADDIVVEIPVDTSGFEAAVADLASPATTTAEPPADASDVNPTLTADPLAGIVCMRGRCPACKRTVNLVNHHCGAGTTAAAVPDAIAEQAAKQEAARAADGLPANPEFDVDDESRKTALSARYKALDDDAKRRYVTIRPADTNDLDAVKAALDAVTPPSPLASSFVTSVVGVTYTDDYPANINDLTEGQHLVLTHDRNNPHDINAIRVSWARGQIGHLPRPVAATLARRLDEHELWEATVDSIVGAPEQRGLIIACRQVETRDRKAVLLERFQLLSDDQKRRYRKPADTNDLDAVAAAIDAIDPFADVIATPSTPPAAAPKAASAEQAPTLDEGGLEAGDNLAALEQAFAALSLEHKLTCARITKEARDAGHAIAVTAWPTVRRWHIARAIIRALNAGHDYDTLLCAAVTIPDDPAQTRDPDNLGGLLGTFTIAQADSLYDAVDHPADDATPSQDLTGQGEN